MAISERRARQRAERHRQIVDAAREIAEAEGWEAVTVRRLAERIEYSQPVLYSHFRGKDAIVGAVALEGFEEFTASLTARVATLLAGEESLRAVADAYLEFAEGRPALYEAMFTLATDLPFADPASPPQLQAGFGVLRDTLGAATGEQDLDARTELAWSALHGLATLTGSGRMRREEQDGRLQLLVAQWMAVA
jgi:AcrR family transcriptional regulator